MRCVAFIKVSINYEVRCCQKVSINYEVRCFYNGFNQLQITKVAFPNTRLASR